MFIYCIEFLISPIYELFQGFAQEVNSRITYLIQLGGDFLLNSYSQLFFSNNRWFALLLLLSTFVDPYCGISGMVALLVAHIASFGLKLPEAPIRKGLYGYNSLLTGLVMGIYFEYSPEFWLILILGSFLTLLISVWLASVQLKSNLPLLGIPFLVSIWTILLSVRSFQTLELSERGLFMQNELFEMGGITLVRWYEFMQYPPIPRFWEVFLKSLGAIFFQYNVVSGFFIAIGVLIYSRIAFSLSLLGFTTGYFFYQAVGGGLSEIYYSFVGFNFILAAISLGGFFVIPSWRSYLLVIVMTPLMAMVLSALNYLFLDLQLPLYSLPFNLLILLLIVVLRLNFSGKGIQLVGIQEFQPEKNLYRYLNYTERFSRNTPVVVHPPFWGEWNISQDDKGKITHLGEWRHAWDFVVRDESGQTYKSPGTQVTDYYAYNLPVLAAASGTVIEVLEGVPDNAVGDVELIKNWGNTVIIWHGGYLYSKISHLKTGSIFVKKGDYVYKGDTLGVCGNSGRSPEPHIHFQLQSTPYVGARTLQYPLGYYLEKQNGNWKFRQFDYPTEGSTIQGLVPTSILHTAFNWPLGKVWLWELNSADDKKKMIRWEVLSDVSGNKYIWCAQTQSTAWFNSDDTCFWFYHFTGKRTGLLYHFYRAHLKVSLAWHADIQIEENYPVHHIWKRFSRYLQDFAAPFYVFMKGTYHFSFGQCDDPYHPAAIQLKSTTERKIFSHRFSRFEYSTNINAKGIQTFTLLTTHQTAECIED